jgi:hypothetical protein
MHETQKIDSGHTVRGPSTPHRAFVHCGCDPVIVLTTVGIMRLDDTNVHAFRAIILPHENTQRTPSSTFTLPEETKRTMATVVRRGAPR